MEYIKKHKMTVFIIAVWIIIIGFFYFLYSLFIGSNGEPVYGDRLDGIEKVPITEKQIKEIKSEIEKEDFVLKVTKPYLSGKILKVVVTVADTADENKTKALTDKVTAVLDDKQKAFYDVEFYATKYYNCSLEATGKMDEDGNFIDKVTVKFSDDLSKNKYALEYGVSDKKDKDYNKKQTFDIEKDGTYTIYGFTKDKLGESSCSIKIVMKKADIDTEETTVKSSLTRNFPIIGYRKYGTDKFVWTKTRK